MRLAENAAQLSENRKVRVSAAKQIANKRPLQHIFVEESKHEKGNNGVRRRRQCTAHSN